MSWGAGGQLPAGQTPPGAAGVRGAGWQRGVSDGKGGRAGELALVDPHEAAAFLRETVGRQRHRVASVRLEDVRVR